MNAKVEFALTKTVPLPGYIAGAGRSKYPFAKMRVGESFFVPKDERDLIRIQSNLGSAARNGRWGSRKFKTAVIRKDHPLWDGAEGIRVWRIK